MVGNNVYSISVFNVILILWHFCSACNASTWIV